MSVFCSGLFVSRRGVFEQAAFWIQFAHRCNFTMDSAELSANIAVVLAQQAQKKHPTSTQQAPNKHPASTQQHPASTQQHQKAVVCSWFFCGTLENHCLGIGVASRKAQKSQVPANFAKICSLNRFGAGRRAMAWQQSVNGALLRSVS